MAEQRVLVARRMPPPAVELLTQAGHRVDLVAAIQFDNQFRPRRAEIYN